MNITLMDGPMRGDIYCARIKPGDCVQIAITPNPDLLNKPDQQTRVIRAVYRVTDSGVAWECAKPEMTK